MFRILLPSIFGTGISLAMHDKDYREDLRNEFLRRSKNRQQYSLRAFARDLEMSPSRLSDLLNLKSHLSLRTAQKICARLDLTESEKRKWYAKVEMLASRSPTKRKAAATEFQKIDLKRKIKSVPNAQFSLLSEWYMLAIIELAADGKLDSQDRKWAMALGMDLFVYRQAIKRLVDANYIVLKGTQYFTVDRSHLAGDQGPSSEIRQFHEQLLKQAVDRLHRLHPKLRDFNARYISLTTEQFDTLKGLIRDFLALAFENAGSQSPSSEVYALTVQLFPLTQIKNVNSLTKGSSEHELPSTGDKK